MPKSLDGFQVAKVFFACAVSSILQQDEGLIDTEIIGCKKCQILTLYAILMKQHVEL